MISCCSGSPPQLYLYKHPRNPSLLNDSITNGISVISITNAISVISTDSANSAHNYNEEYHEPNCFRQLERTAQRCLSQLIYCYSHAISAISTASANSAISADTDFPTLIALLALVVRLHIISTTSTFQPCGFNTNSAISVGTDLNDTSTISVSIVLAHYITVLAPPSGFNANSAISADTDVSMLIALLALVVPQCARTLLALLAPPSDSYQLARQQLSSTTCPFQHKYAISMLGISSGAKSQR